MDLSYLANLSEQEFERERCRLLGEALDSASNRDQRIAGLELQLKLDVRRETMPREQYIASLFTDIGENLENLSDQFVAINNTLTPKV